MNSILKENYKSWKDLEKVIESLPTSNEKGEVFEQFAYLYFKIKKKYYQISKIWRVNSIPAIILKKLKIERTDAGIDGLIENIDGTYTAYQVKFRSKRKKPSYSELTKFWQEARYCDAQLTFANCSELTNLSKKNKKHLQILSIELDELDSDFFQNLKEISLKKKIKSNLFKPEKYQKKIIKDVVEGFKKEDRGKLIAACGTGKTLTALWISEKLKYNKILFIAPSIALIKQTLTAWSQQSKYNFRYICICSDPTVVEEKDDIADINEKDLGVPVTTDPILISNKIKNIANEKFIIFSTYHSLGVLKKVVNKNKFNFDLAFFDEAHRTAGTNDTESFSLALFNNNISIKKRLFMTATERLIKPNVLRKAKQLNRIVFSMDDEDLYGKLFHRLSFGEAIKQNVISDYQILIAGVSNSEIFEWIRANTLLVSNDSNSDNFKDSALNIFKQILLYKVMENYPVKKIISFHNSIKLAKDFIFGTKEYGETILKIFKKINPKTKLNNYLVNHVNGTLSASSRYEILNQFKESNFGIISNSRCLTEGVDVPIIDSIYFVDPRNSLIDIVQACGRALRKPREAKIKTAYFIIPILIPDGNTKEALNKIDYDMIHLLIQSLRSQDSRLEQWIESLNLSMLNNKKNKKYIKNEQIKFVLPTEFNIQEFEKNIYLRIGAVNNNPEISELDKIKSTGSRKSGSKRIFRTIGDYSWSSYDSSLIQPTLKLFKSNEDLVSRKKISLINHNASSHGHKLGILESTNKENCKLTEVGKILKSSPFLFKDIFKEQILKYFEVSNEIIIFPYREIIKLLCEFESINYFEFCFAIYGINNVTPEFKSLIKKRFEYVKNTYNNLKIASDKNKLKILDDLNLKFSTTFTAKDIWTTSTTVSNQWIYWKNHLSLLEDVEKDDKNKSIFINSKNIKKVNLLLSKTKYIEELSNNEELRYFYRSRNINVDLFKI